MYWCTVIFNNNYVHDDDLHRGIKLMEHYNVPLVLFPCVSIQDCRLHVVNSVTAALPDRCMSCHILVGVCCGVNGTYRELT